MMNIRKTNNLLIIQNEQFKKEIDKIKSIELLIRSYGDLSFGRDFILCCNHTFSLQTIITSLELTAGSIALCCECGCIADANTLLRKYRDDMFFYLYLVLYYVCKDSHSDWKELPNIEKNIKHWFDNKLADLEISLVFKTIGSSPIVEKTVQKYNLHSSFNIIGTRLNNYVHGNGIKYYNRHFNTYKDDEFRQELTKIANEMNFITVTFLFLLSLCSPSSIMSEDYINCLDCSIKPDNGSQYWVAPFILEYFKKNKSLLGDNIIKYMSDETNMVFN